MLCKSASTRALAATASIALRSSLTIWHRRHSLNGTILAGAFSQLSSLIAFSPLRSLTFSISTCMFLYRPATVARSISFVSPLLPSLSPFFSSISRIPGLKSSSFLPLTLDTYLHSSRNLKSHSWRLHQFIAISSHPTTNTTNTTTSSHSSASLKALNAVFALRNPRLYLSAGISHLRSSRCNSLHFSRRLHLLRRHRPQSTGLLPMASASASTSSSFVCTPRSSSPSASVCSFRSSTSTERISVSSAHRTFPSNPLSSGDISTIEESIKMAALDQHRGYSQSNYSTVKQLQMTQYISQEEAGGYQVLREAHWNKGESLRICVALMHFFPGTFSLLSFPKLGHLWFLSWHG